ncbi:alpha/beta hydrolase [Sodalis sp. dw_96]|uniref:alpha/beta hydrolase n=1 Tax=Sodalis sp. dw_96 TaxID=2719794 RepID=UPI001BD4881E|nr:alpha/beta hydrolase [Sodalis sp. dw_96]
MKLSSTVTRIASAITFSLVAFGSTAASAAPVKNIVLVHGYFADGSGWQAVSNILSHDGYTVSVVQEPETSFADDVKATTRVVDAHDGPSILVGHSYGGAVITEAGNDPKVAGLVYIAAFEPDAGESAMDLAKKIPSASQAIKPTADGFLYIDPKSFHADFAADIPAAEARFMAASQVMPNGQTFGTPITTAAWKTKPSWALVATADRMISPDLERFMTKRAGSTTIDVKSSHVAYLSQAPKVAKLIELAANNAQK